MDCRLPAGINRPMRINPVSGLVMAVALGIIFIGAGEYLRPASGALGFGVLLLDPQDADLLAVRAVRNVVSGIPALTLLSLHNRKFLACAWGA